MARKQGMPIPEKFANKPNLKVGLDFYWRAFWECSTDRQMGMAEGPIPWTAVHMWAFRYGVVGEDFERLVLILKHMDGAYLEERNKAHKKKLDTGMRGQGTSASKKPLAASIADVRQTRMKK